MIKKVNFHFILVFLAAVFWGTAGIFVRNLEDTFGQMQLVFWRAVLSAIVFGLIIIFKDKTFLKINLKDIWLFICAALFSIVLFNFSYYTTMSLTSLSVAAVLLYTAPFFVVIISVLIFKERLNINKISACVVAFVGCCFVTGLFDTTQRLSTKSVFYGLLTGFGYALYTIFGKLLMKRGYKTLTITFYIFFFAAIFTIPFINPAETVVSAVKNKEDMIIVALMAVFNTVIPYILYTAGLKGVDPSVAPIIATVEPVVATLVGCFIFNEDISFYGIIGIVLVLASVVILNSSKLTLKANAKINLSLAINGKREDGYHLIDTVMQSVSLYDTITISKASELTVKCSMQEIAQEENIAYKAAKLFFEYTKLQQAAKINIIKKIPAAAGLGGGSADAAAVLLGLDRLYNTGLSVDELQKLALALGADVPFFIKGGTQRAEGIGERLTPLKELKNGWFVLVKEGEKPSTAEMYKRLDAEKQAKIEIKDTVEALKAENLQALAKSCRNSFVAVWKNSFIEQKLLQLSADAVSLSGSGPTWFAFFTNRSAAKRAIKLLKKEKISSYLVKSCEQGVEFSE